MLNLFSILGLLALSFSTFATEVSFTIDDPGVQAAPNMDHLAVGERLVRAFEKHKLKTVLFVCGMRIDTPAGQRLLDLWEAKKHSLGSHTYSNQNYNSARIDYSSFSRDILKNEALLQNRQHFKKFFRYPMLKEGNSASKRDQARALLKQRGYSLGQVSIDASDWYISDRLVEKLKKGGSVNLEAYRNYFLAHIWDRAQYYNDLSKKVLGREIKHNVLLHHNPLNAYFLDDLIAMFKAKGWKVIDADAAFKDPAYALSPNILPAGESLLWGLAKETGRFESVLRYPGEDGEYLKAEMDQLGL